MKNSIKIRTVGLDELGRIEKLWKKLSEVHEQDSLHFKEHYRTLSFRERCKPFYEKKENEIKIDILSDKKTPVGYCVSTFSESRGEIESIFIEKEYRKYGYGRELMERSIHWMESNKCSVIEVSVAAGHESVFSFYQELGFYPRMTYLRKINTE